MIKEGNTLDKLPIVIQCELNKFINNYWRWFSKLPRCYERRLDKNNAVCHLIKFSTII